MPTRSIRSAASISTVTALAAVLGTLSLAGCTSSTTSQDASNTTKKSADSTTTKTTKTGCAAIDKDALSAAFGSDYTTPEETVVDSVTVCSFTTPNGAVTIRIDADSNSERFDGVRAGFATSKQATTDVSGVGDKAYTSTLKAGKLVVTTLDALKGTVEILVSSSTSLEQEKQFETQLFTSVG